MTISHAKILIERKRNVQISMTSKNLSPMYLSHRKALQDMLHQHKSVNPDNDGRQRKEVVQSSTSPTFEGKRKQAVSRAPSADERQSTRERLRGLTGRLLQKGHMDLLSALPELWKRFQQLV